MADFYNLILLNMTRQLPIMKTPSGIKIAGFNSVGDTELICKSAKFLVELLSKNNINFDIILTTELKGIPIAQEVARLTNKDYVCLRKQAKCYMLSPVKISSESITSGKTEFYLSKPDFDNLKNRKVLFVDDVFSTGSTMNGMLNFAKSSNFDIIAGAFILKEVNKENLDSPLVFEFNNKPVLCCGILPLQ